jgi:ABC-2 type transport system permease protein
MSEHPASVPLLVRQSRHQNKLFLRNPFSAFFSLAFPLMFLLLFGSLNGSQRIPELGGIRYAQFLTPGLLAFAVCSTCYTGLTTSVAMSRDLGILKRVRGTPAAVVTLLLGAACFCALGLAVAALIPNGEAAPIVANFTFLPVAFISDVFFPMAGAPQWLQTVGGLFPVKHFALALEATFNPFVAGSGFRWGDLAVIALWGVAAAVVAVRNFQWEPRTAGPIRSRGRR